MDKDELYNATFRQEIDNILQSFLEKKPGGGPPTIARYDIPHIVELIDKRISLRLRKIEAEKAS